MKKLLFISYTFLILISCDGLEYKKHIVGNYYIIKSEGEIDLSYKLENGAYVGKAPSNIVEYGFNQKYILAKTRNSDKSYSFFIIDRAKDFGSAIEENFRIGPITEVQFEKNWKPQLNIELHKVEE